MHNELVEYNTANVFSILQAVRTQSSTDIESETIEFKEYTSEKSLHNDKELSCEICALANWKGGVVVIGVKDGNNVKNNDWLSQLTGFPKTDLAVTEERIKGRLQSAVELRAENISYDSKNYLAIFIRKHRTALVLTTSGKAYIREGKSSRPMTGEEVERAVKSLQNYDWSADFIEGITNDALVQSDVTAALERYCQLRNLTQQPTVDGFLEAIEAKRNGLITKGGLLFLGNPEDIKKHLGDVEFRFSWKEGVDLKKNEVWSGNLWNAITKAKQCFESCVTNIKFKYQNNEFIAPNLDPIAFHEAFLNAIAHRDYSVDGMVTVEFVGTKLTITSPGTFYGGVTASNIFFHDPRHRNKALAKILMEYKFVDRAGMGILRMGIKSLIYGRRFPTFEEQKNSVRVSMDAEYVRPGIFVMTNQRTELYIPDLIILNALYERGQVSALEAIELIGRAAPQPWIALEKFLERWELFVELCANKDAILVRVKENAVQFLDVQKVIRVPQNSSKYVSLFRFLRKHVFATNEDVSNLLEYSHSSTTSRFLGELKWLERTGRGVASKWGLTRPYL